MKLDISSLDKAVARLAAGLVRCAQNLHDDQLRDGLLQRFEFTYELSHKMLKRYLQSVAANSAAYNGMAFQDLIRSGNEAALLLGDWPAWRQYRDMRSQTSHGYDEARALQVVAGIPAFLAEAQYLLDQLQRRL